MLDYYYLILVVPAIILSLWAQAKVSSAFSKYSKYRSENGMTGFDAARRILDSNELQNVRIERISGNLTDHYDPRSNVIRLSDNVYDVPSVAAVGVAAHEAGHAVQHSVNYMPIKWRNAVLPIANLGSQAAIPLAFLGLILGFKPLITFGIVLFSAVVLFQLVTLPVEFNASGRAIAILGESGMLSDKELKGVKKVLTAAAMTYVAAALTSLMNLIRLIMISKDRD